MDLNLVIAAASLILGLISVFIGIWVAGRFTGKFKSSMIFLIIAVIVFVIEETMEILDFLAIANLRIVKNIALMVIILFILLATINMKSMINRVNNHYRKR